jgi:hypothetical protein
MMRMNTSITDNNIPPFHLYLMLSISVLYTLYYSIMTIDRERYLFRQCRPVYICLEYMKILLNLIFSLNVMYILHIAYNHGKKYIKHHMPLKLS